jgi:integrase
MANLYGLYQRSGTKKWYLPVIVDVLGKKQRRCVSTGTEDYGEACRRAPEIIHRERSGLGKSNQGPTINEAFAEVISLREGTGAAKNTLVNYRQAKRMWGEFLGEDKLITAITREDIQRFVENNEYAQGTKRNRMMLLSAVIHHVKNNNPTLAIAPNLFPKGYLSKKTIQHGKRSLSQQELTLVLQECQPEHRDYIIAFVYSGMRKQELFSIKAEHIDMDKDTILVPGTKNKASYAAIPLASALKSVLARRIAHADNGFLFPSLINLSTSFRRLAQRIGIEPFTVHDLRRTCGSLLINSGVDIASVQAILRHADIATTIAVYAHLTPATKKEAIDKLPPLNSSGRIRQIGEGRRRIDNVRVRQIDMLTGEVVGTYDSIAECVKATGISSVGKCVTGVRRSAKGYYFERIGARKL